MLCFSSCLFKAPPTEHLASSDWSAHSRLSQCHWQQQSSCAKSILTFQTRWWTHNFANMWHGDVVWCHKVTEVNEKESILELVLASWEQRWYVTKHIYEYWTWVGLFFIHVFPNLVILNVNVSKTWWSLPLLVKKTPFFWKGNDTIFSH